jgi:hypothetical protein
VLEGSMETIKDSISGQWSSLSHNISDWCQRLQDCSECPFWLKAVQKASDERCMHEVMEVAINNLYL